MITDRFPLTGKASYLQGPGGRIDLAAVASSGTAPNTTTGALEAIGVHRVLDVDSIDLLLSAPDLSALYSYQTQPLIEVITRKEMFPMLSTDPYARRVHTVAGTQDLRRGKSERFRVMDIDARATLVSEPGGVARWTSPLYRFADTKSFAEVAWDLVPSRLTPPGAFSYSLTAAIWDGPPDALIRRGTVVLIANGDASSIRAAQLARDTNATAVQFTFEASITREADIAERHMTGERNSSLGVPLLQAIHLLERRKSQMSFHSLHELNAAARDLTFYGSGDAPLTTCIARLDYRAALTGTDTLEVVVRNGVFDRAEARLLASIIERPPLIHR